MWGCGGVLGVRRCVRVCVCVGTDGLRVQVRDCIILGVRHACCIHVIVMCVFGLSVSWPHHPNLTLLLVMIPLVPAPPSCQLMFFCFVRGSNG